MILRLTFIVEATLPSVPIAGDVSCKQQEIPAGVYPVEYQRQGYFAMSQAYLLIRQGFDLGEARTHLFAGSPKAGVGLF
jgi:hypothetical protein